MSNLINLDPASLRWKTRWVLRRNRVVGSRKFQDWAARMPIFRSIARRKAVGQFNLIAGFVYTQITFAFVELGLLHFLRDSPREVGAVAEFLELGSDAADRLLRAGCAVGLAESPQAGLWTLGQSGAALSANEGALAIIRHHRLFYRDLSDPHALLASPRGAGSELSAFWTYSSANGSDARDSRDAGGAGAGSYSELMGATQPMVWNQIINRYKFHSHRRMLDIGGGSGAFVEAVGKAVPGLCMGIFDLPAIARLARARFVNTPLEPRIAVHSGNFQQETLPIGYDLITLVRILHDHDDNVAQCLLGKIYDSLPENGRLLIVEPMAGTCGAEEMGDAYFGLYLWAIGSGRPRSLQENSQMLKKAGFSKVRKVKTALPIVATALVASK